MTYSRLPQPRTEAAPHQTASDLSRLLSRLKKVILEPDPQEETRLRRSEYERSKVGANLEYARTLLLQLEHESSGTKIQSRRQTLQNELRSQREVVKQLNERLYQYGRDVESDNFVNDPELEELLDEFEDDTSRKTQDMTAASAVQSSTQPDGVRPRYSGLGREREGQAKTTSPDLQDAESKLSHNRTEQEDLTSSLLNMAQALKQSSRSFATSLESEKETLDRAGEGLETNVTGLQAAEKRMGTLRRMTEGKGWWGRMMMYAWIAGLMFLALVIVGFLPKLRF